MNRWNLIILFGMWNFILHAQVSTFKTDNIIIIPSVNYLNGKNSLNTSNLHSLRGRFSQFVDKPKLIFNDTLICGRIWGIITIGFDRPVISTWLAPLQTGVNIIDAGTLHPEIRANTYGKYRFRLQTNGSDGVQYYDTISISFRNQPIADYELDAVKCKGYNLKLSVNPGNTVESALYKWYSNDTVFSTGIDQKQIEIPLGFGQGTRSVGLEINEKGCIAKKTEQVKVMPEINLWVDNPVVCTPMKVQFNNSDINENNTYQWNFGDGSTSTLKAPSHTFINNSSKDLTFRVSVDVVSNEGCRNTGFLQNAIIVHPMLAVDMDFDEKRCYSDTVTIFYKGSATDKDLYSWKVSILSPDELVTDPGKTKGPLRVYRHTKPTLEISVAVKTQEGCQSDTVKKVLKFRPAFTVSADNVSGCAPLRTLFSAKPLIPNDMITYNWDFGYGIRLSGNNPSYLFTKPDTWFDMKTISYSSLTQCSDTVTIPKMIRVFANPDAVFKPNSSEVSNSDPVITFNNVSTGAVEYSWDFGDSSKLSVEENPMHRFPDLGYYKVLLTAMNEFGCVDTASEIISVVFERLFPPNAFSPNSPAEIDRVFRIYSRGIIDEGYSLIVFNRWGERIFESQSQEIGWNGMMKNGNPAPVGVYPWVARYFDFMKKEHKQQGTVTLLY